MNLLASDDRWNFVFNRDLCHFCASQRGQRARVDILVRGVTG
jgi:hypothetical protein